MNSDGYSSHSLPPDARSAVWRIFGAGESPLTQMTSCNLVESVINKRVSPPFRRQSKDEILAWFETDGEHRSLKSEMYEPVADMILRGLYDALSSRGGFGEGATAFWAIGFIEPDIAAPTIRRVWTADAIDCFTEYAIKTLERLCREDSVLDANKLMSLDAPKARASLMPVENREMLKAYQELEEHFWWLYPGVARIVNLVINLNPDSFYEIVDKIDHRMVQSHAANCLIYQDHSDNRTPLRWLTRESSDELIALAVTHTLRNINELDSERLIGNKEESEKGELDAAAGGLLSELVRRLTLLGPDARARWLVELLNFGVSSINRSHQNEKPQRVEQLETGCEETLQHLICQSWSDELSDVLRQGLCLSPFAPKVLPLARAALKLRETHPARSVDIARLILKALDQKIADAINDDGSFHYDVSHWRYDDWARGLAIALVLSDESRDIRGWVESKCRELPLSIWDVEENYGRFLDAEKIAQFLFIVALYALQMRDDVGRRSEPAEYLSMAESIWEHCHFANQHSGAHLSEGSVVAGFAARVAVELGKPSDTWLLEQSGRRGVGPRAMWVLLEQRISRDDISAGTTERVEGLTSTEFRHIALERFGDVIGADLESLWFLGNLWLALDAPDEAERTAMAIIAFPQRQLNRTYLIFALKLLAFSVSKRRPSSLALNQTTLLYERLWASPYTPSGEQEERQTVDDMLKGVAYTR